MAILQCVVHCLYGSKTRGPEDDSVEWKHVALISSYMFNITTVVFDLHILLMYKHFGMEHLKFSLIQLAYLTASVQPPCGQYECFSY